MAKFMRFEKLRIVKYVNPKWWFKLFFPKDSQVEYQHEVQEECKFDGNESNSITDHPKECLTQEMPCKMENPGESLEDTATDESCFLEENRGLMDGDVKTTVTSPDDVGQSELHCQLEAVGLCDRTMPVCEDSGPVSEDSNQDEETGRKDRIPVRTDLPSSDDVDMGPWKTKHPRRSVDFLDTTCLSVADSFTNMSVSATPPNTPIRNEVKSKAKRRGSVLEQSPKEQS
uniref:BRCT domain-containing protein n=1 Tax=Angiostrongylus cantonensis TaxID=6313 RepID=A0A0K0CX07_ANGCA